jgi:hypothetical protein
MSEFDRKVSPMWLVQVSFFDELDSVCAGDTFFDRASRDRFILNYAENSDYVVRVFEASWTELHFNYIEPVPAKIAFI